MASFSVCAMVWFGPAVIGRFIAHYRALGAGRLHLYHDGPVDHLAGLDLDRVTLVACDAAFWARFPGGRPADMSAAIALCHAEAVRAATTDWIILVDVDEFVTAGAPLAALLDRVPERVEALRVPPLEAVWGPGDDPGADFGARHFRRPFPPRWPEAALQRLLYGDLAPYFGRGLLSHKEGKQILRCGRRYDAFGMHAVWRDGRALGVWAAGLAPGLETLELLHYDAIGFAHWAEKWRRRTSGAILTPGMSPRRQAQAARLAALVAAGDEAGLRRLFRRFYGLSRGQALLLSALGCLVRRDPLAALPPP
jgi:hypothetical protein